MKRIDRTGVIIKTLTENPGRLFSLNYFTELFDAAKSTVSEDITIAKKIVEEYSFGKIITLAGAAGGVKYMPVISEQELSSFQDELCDMLREKSRWMTGGFLFTSDLMFNPNIAKKAGAVFATEFQNRKADYVVTIETKGISLAVMTADAMNLPLVVMRRESKISEGSTISINYISGNGEKIQKMSVSKKSLQPGKKAIIIDDFMRGGGSARGMTELLGELDVETVGIGVLIATEIPETKKVSDYFPILYMNTRNDGEFSIDIYPNKQRTPK